MADRRGHAVRHGENGIGRFRELLAVHPPPILPGETPPEGYDVIYDGPVSVRVGGALFYGADGEPLRDTGNLSALRQLAEIRTAPGGHLLSRPLYRAGVRIAVSTAYLGVDLGHRANCTYPQPWETLILIGRRRVPGVITWEYVTRAAARAGHHAVLFALKAEQQRRRRQWKEAR